MLADYTDNLYIPLCNLTNKYYNNLELVTEYAKIKDNLYSNWEDIVITQTNNLDNISIDAGNNINVSCSVKLPNIEAVNIEAQCYYGKVSEDRNNREYKCNPNGISFTR